MWRRLQMSFDWRRHAPRLATGLLGSLIALDASHTVWAVRVLSRVPKPPPPVAVPQRDRGYDIDQVVQAHLFGEPARAPVQMDAANAPETQLDLTLTGVVATADPKTGFAILRAADKPAHFYRVGANLEETTGGRLHRVFVDRVVLELDGKLQTLRLPRQALGSTAAQTNVADSAAGPGATPTTAPSPDEITPAEGVFANLNVEPNPAAGQTAGMVMHPAKRFQREYGLKDSDVLTAVNGVEITDADVLASTLRTNAKSLSVTVVRDGTPRTIRLPSSY
jgi:general secretion pathway protein C